MKDGAKQKYGSKANKKHMSQTQGFPPGHKENVKWTAVELVDLRRSSLDSNNMSILTTGDEESAVHLGGLQDLGMESDIQQILKDGYHVAKMREEELTSKIASGVSVAHTIYMQQAVKVYAAMSTLLYATISIKRAEDLEKFIIKRSSSLPAVILDIGDWKVVMQAARQYRSAYTGIDASLVQAMTPTAPRLNQTSNATGMLPDITRDANGTNSAKERLQIYNELGSNTVLHLHETEEEMSGLRKQVGDLTATLAASQKKVENLEIALKKEKQLLTHLSKEVEDKDVILQAMRREKTALQVKLEQSMASTSTAQSVDVEETVELQNHLKLAAAAQLGAERIANELRSTTAIAVQKAQDKSLECEGLVEKLAQNLTENKNLAKMLEKSEASLAAAEAVVVSSDRGLEALSRTQEAFDSLKVESASNARRQQKEIESLTTKLHEVTADLNRIIETSANEDVISGLKTEISLLEETNKKKKGLLDQHTKNALEKTRTLQAAEAKVTELTAELSTSRATEHALREAMDSLAQYVPTCARERNGTDLGEEGEISEKLKADVSEKEDSLAAAGAAASVKVAALEAELAVVKSALSEGKVHAEAARIKHENELAEQTLLVTEVEARLGEVTIRLGSSEAAAAMMENRLDMQKEAAEEAEKAGKDAADAISTLHEAGREKDAAVDKLKADIADLEAKLLKSNTDYDELKKRADCADSKLETASVVTSAKHATALASSEIHFKALITEREEKIESLSTANAALKTQLLGQSQAFVVDGQPEKQHYDLVSKVSDLEGQLHTVKLQLVNAISIKEEEVNLARQEGKNSAVALAANATAEAVNNVRSEEERKEVETLKEQLEMVQQRVIVLQNQLDDTTYSTDNALASARANNDATHNDSKDSVQQATQISELGAEIHRLQNVLKDVEERKNQAEAHSRKQHEQLQAMREELTMAMHYTREDRPNNSRLSNDTGLNVADERKIGHFRISTPSSKIRPKHMHKKRISNMNKKQAVLMIQAAARGMLERARLWHSVHTSSAAQSGMFVAVPGTIQGRTGWYQSPFIPGPPGPSTPKQNHKLASPKNRRNHSKERNGGHDYYYFYMDQSKGEADWVRI